MKSADDTIEHDDRLSAEPLGPRRAAILAAVVTEHVGTATPVGSHHVSQAPGINVSSATVRADMVALEQEGYLVQPHTSAGRIPTDKGYRFFVDHLAEPGVLGTVQRQKVTRFFDQVHGEMEEVLERASGLLSDITSCAAVVVGPSREATSIRSAQLISLTPQVALLIIVFSDGAVEKRSLELGQVVSDDVLSSVSAELQGKLQGRVLADVQQIAAHPSTGVEEFNAVLDAAWHALLELSQPHDPDNVFVGGPSRLALAFDAVETVRSVLSILEQQLVVVNLLRDVLDRGLSVAIGTEHGYEQLASCAVVVAPVSGLGAAGGAVGLLGPTRMNYPLALAAAHVVGEELSGRLGGEKVGDGAGD